MRAHVPSFWLVCVAPALLAISPWWSACAQETGRAEQPVTAKIVLGPYEGVAHPTGCGRTATGGGNIHVSQPAPDTLVIRMSGNVAACGNLLAGADAALDFCERLQFAVEFSQPGHMGQLVMDAKLVGLLTAQGIHTGVGVMHAAASVSCGSEPIATLAMPTRTLGGGQSVALNLAQGPICAPVYAGCHSLHQVFRVFANQQAGSVCGRGIAEFSPSPLTPAWLGPSYPFQNVDKADFGYQLTLRVVPDQ